MPPVLLEGTLIRLEVSNEGSRCDVRIVPSNLILLIPEERQPDRLAQPLWAVRPRLSLADRLRHRCCSAAENERAREMLVSPVSIEEPDESRLRIRRADQPQAVDRVQPTLGAGSLRGKRQ